MYLDLAKRWAKGTAILFAVGAVSGTVLSFELGLLWPRFMELAGPLIGMPFSLEGFAFFTEAIFLGIYLYGWERISPRAHLAAGVVVAVSGAASAVFVVMVNAWMNTPAGITLADGRIATIDPIAGMLNPSTFQQALHMLLASYAATGLAVAGVHAAMLLRGATSAFHRHALTLALASARRRRCCSRSRATSARASWRCRSRSSSPRSRGSSRRSGRAAPHRRDGPTSRRAETRCALEIPHGLSLLAFHDPNAEVNGLERVRARRLAAGRRRCTSAFRSMVASRHGDGARRAVGGVRRAAASAISSSETWLLRALAIVAPFGFIATEAGWTVTEVGRQPWVVQGMLRTADAVTPMPGLVVPMLDVHAALRRARRDRRRRSSRRSCGRRRERAHARSIGLPEIVAGDHRARAERVRAHGRRRFRRRRVGPARERPAARRAARR